MQALKALVIVMGVLIIAGMGLLVYGLMTRVSWEDDSASSGAAKSFGDVSQTLPAGASVGEISVDGGRAVVQVRLPGGGAELRVYDLSTGAAMGTIQLKAAP